jgi:hypothetical protein
MRVPPGTLGFEGRAARAGEEVPTRRRRGRKRGRNIEGGRAPSSAKKTVLSFWECARKRREERNKTVKNSNILKKSATRLLFSGHAIELSARGKERTRDDGIFYLQLPGLRRAWQYEVGPVHGQVHLSGRGADFFRARPGRY